MKTMEHLFAERDSFLSDADLPGSWTPQEREDYCQRRREASWHASRAPDALKTLLAWEERLDADREWQTHLHTWRGVLAAELAALPSTPSRTLDRKIASLTASLRVIDLGLGTLADYGCALAPLRLGELMRRAGFAPLPPPPGAPLNFQSDLPWFGGLDEVESRVREAQRRIADARSKLECLREPGDPPVLPLGRHATADATPAEVTLT
jgi:hypothetical protein